VFAYGGLSQNLKDLKSDRVLSSLHDHALNERDPRSFVAPDVESVPPPSGEVFGFCKLPNPCHHWEFNGNKIFLKLTRLSHEGGAGLLRVLLRTAVQGYLAHQKHPPPRTLH